MTFKPGQSGNPAGRTKGSVDKRMLFRKLIEPYSEKLCKKAVDLAMAGEPNMIKMLISRMIPARPPDDPVKIPGLAQATLAKKAELIVAKLADGEITPTQAISVISVITQQAKIIETDEIVARLTNLENKIDTQIETSNS